MVAGAGIGLTAAARSRTVHAVHETSEPSVRLLREDELPAATRVVGVGMLGTIDDASAEAWAPFFEPERSHGAFAADGTLAGLARWFPSELSVPGGSVTAACVTAVAVVSTHRRQGHLSRLMGAQMDAIVAERIPVALLVAAEWPIYGRFGYGPAVDACGWQIDTTAARFIAPATGRVELCDPASLLPHLVDVHDRRWARTPGAVTRTPEIWERVAGTETWPNDKTEPGRRRGAVWRDDAGEVQGAVAYVVHEGWQRNRPAGKAEVGLLVGATPEAERELWRHLCEIDWVTTVTAGNRSIDDPLPLFLTDGRAAVQVDRFDCIWARVLDVPAAFGARRSAAPGRVVLQVDDRHGYAEGRWSIALDATAADVAPTDEPADVRLPAHALGALYLGGQAAARMQEAGWVEELQPGGVERLDALLRTPTAPWSPTTY